MRFSTVATAAAALVAGVSAAPGGWGGWQPQNCLNDTGVAYLINGYTYLLEYPQGKDFNATANAILENNFFVLSDSINTLAGIPVRTPPQTTSFNTLPLSQHDAPASIILTFLFPITRPMCFDVTNPTPFQLGVPAYPSKAAFIAGQAQTPPIPVLQTVETYETCNKITWRWIGSNIGSNKYRVSGIISMDVNVADLKINAVYSEFNTGAWLADIGNPECPKK